MTNVRIVTSGLACLALIYGAGLSLLSPQPNGAHGASATVSRSTAIATDDLAVPADPAVAIHWTEPKAILVGRVPDEASLAQLIARAHQTYGAANVDADMRIVAGKPPGWWATVAGMFPPDLRVARDASLLVNAGQAFLVGAIARESDRRDLVENLRNALGSAVVLDDQTLAPDAIAQSQRRAAMKAKPSATAVATPTVQSTVPPYSSSAPDSAPNQLSNTPAAQPAGPTLRQP